MAFRSKVDWWLGVLLVVGPVVALAVAAWTTFSGDAAAMAVGWSAFAGMLLLYWALVWPVVYTLEAETLVIRFGLIRSRIRYGDIRSVHRSRNPLSSPALSLDRLLIDAGKRSPALISPKDRTGFMAALAARAPHLAFDETGSALRVRDQRE